MLLSMTGYGEARGQTETLNYVVEVRSVNNRHLKLILRATEPYNLLEAEFDKVVRRFVRRGTVQIHLRCDRPYSPENYRLNTAALKSYYQQVRAVSAELGLGDRPEPGAILGPMLAVPGVAERPELSGEQAASEWPLVEQGLMDALGRMQKMREDEGARMAAELLLYRDQIAAQLDSVRERVPRVVAGFRDRLKDRVNALLAASGVRAEPADLVREVAVFAERSDVAEEIVRLASHLEHFGEVLCNDADSPGRKLEFITQEMGREANTIGSKAGDVAVSRHVVEIKAILEKIRELIQNVE